MLGAILQHRAVLLVSSFFLQTYGSDTDPFNQMNSISNGSTISQITAWAMSVVQQATGFKTSTMCCTCSRFILNTVLKKYFVKIIVVVFSPLAAQRRKAKNKIKSTGDR